MGRAEILFQRQILQALQLCFYLFCYSRVKDLAVDLKVDALDPLQLIILNAVLYHISFCN